MIKNYQKTDYPKIFRSSYWGQHLFKESNIEIINNRNEFVKEYNITKLYEPPFQDTVYLDHEEVYRSKIIGPVVLIYSPYILDSKITGFNIKNGFKLVAPLYCISAPTFIKVFENLHAYKDEIVKY